MESLDFRAEELATPRDRRDIAWHSKVGGEGGPSICTESLTDIPQIELTRGPGGRAACTPKSTQNSSTKTGSCNTIGGSLGAQQDHQESAATFLLARRVSRCGEPLQMLFGMSESVEPSSATSSVGPSSGNG